MFAAITRLFSQPDAPEFHNEPKLAVAALLVHLSAVDGQVTDGERAAVKGALMDYYSLDEAEVDRLIADGKNHELEDNMVRRIAELIGVSARDRTTLRKQMSRSEPAD